MLTEYKFHLRFFHILMQMIFQSGLNYLPTYWVLGAVLHAVSILVL